MEQTTPQAQAADLDLYAHYDGWKKWEKTFSFDPEDAEYYAGETRGMDLKGKHVFEIGFGSGNFLAWAESHGAIIAGSEITPAMVEAGAAKGLEMLPENFENEAGRYAGRFSLIVALDVFEHLENAAIVAKLRAASAMLSSDGALILRYPNGQSPFGLSAQNGDVTHLQALSRAKIEQLGAGSGLSTMRYAGAYRIRGRGAVMIVRRLRYALQDLSSRVLNRIWGLDVIWAPVVTQVLRKVGNV